MKRIAILVIALFVFMGIAMAQDPSPTPDATPEPFDPTDLSSYCPNCPEPDPTPFLAPTPEPTPVPKVVCDHTSNSAERFERMRILPPAKIRRITDDGLEIEYSDKHGVYLRQLTTDEQTIVQPKDFWKIYKDKYLWLLVCSICGHVYTIVEVRPEQMLKPK